MTTTMTTYELVANQNNGPMSFDRWAECENALMQQKNLLIERVNDASEPEHFAAILDTLRFVAPMWKAMNYTYKLNEVITRIVNKMYAEMGGVKQLAATCRKNSSRQRFCESEHKYYGDLITDACLMRA